MKNLGLFLVLLSEESYSYYHNVFFLVCLAIKPDKVSLEVVMASPCESHGTRFSVSAIWGGESGSNFFKNACVEFFKSRKFS